MFQISTKQDQIILIGRYHCWSKIHL